MYCRFHFQVHKLRSSQGIAPKAWWLGSEYSLPEWKWKMINMDFITGLPRSRRQHDSIWVIVYWITKSANFLPVKTTNSVEDYAILYIQEQV